MKTTQKLQKLLRRIDRRGVIIICLIAVIGVGALILAHAATTTTLIVNDNTIGTDVNQWQYAGTNWAYYTGDSNKYQGDDHSSSAAGDTATLKFNGISAAYYGAKSPQAGIVGISIDGGTESMVDLYSATRLDNTLLYTSPALASGDHTMKIRLTGNKNASAVGAAAAVDRAIVTVSDPSGGKWYTLEPESGNISGGATAITDSSASGGGGVQFKATSTGGGGTGSWWSGQSDTATTKDGSFAAWRGRPIEIGGSWASSQNAGDAIGSAAWAFGTGAPYANIPRMDFAVGAMIDNSGESWAGAASGAYDSRWAQQLQSIKAQWGSRPASSMYLRFAHEFNGNWYPWSVKPGDVANFNAAWRRYYGLVQTNFPGAKVVWCPNAGSSWDYDIRTLWPGDQYVDVVSVDSYNNYPFADTVDEFNAKINSVSSYGGPTGIETFRQFAAAHGKPMAISEWSNAGTANQGGGGESPVWVQSLHDWLVKNGSQTPASGKVLYEVLFNVAGYGDHYSLFPLDLEPGNTITAAKYQELW